MKNYLALSNSKAESQNLFFDNFKSFALCFLDIVDFRKYNVFDHEGNVSWHINEDGIDFQEGNTFEVNVGTTITVYLEDADGLLVSIENIDIPIPSQLELSAMVENQDVILQVTNGTPDFQIKIYNTQSSLLFEEKIILSSTTAVHHINLSDFPSGIYLVQVQSKESIRSRRILVLD